MTSKPDLADAAEMLWVVLANVSGGDWTKQSPEWQAAAARWRDNYFASLSVIPKATVDPYDDFFTDYEELDHEEQYMKRTVRWGVVSAIVLGVFLALWLLSGDTRPEAAGAITQVDVTIRQYTIRNSAGNVDFFRVGLDKGELVISLGHDLPLAKWLREHQGESRMTLEAK